MRKRLVASETSVVVPDTKVNQEDSSKELVEFLTHDPFGNKSLQVKNGFSNIIDRVFSSDDILTTYTDLERDLVIGENNGDYKSVRDHLDHAEENARRAHKLYLNAKIERHRWEAEYAVVLGTLRAQAKADLELMKAQKTFTKTITDADTEAQIAVDYSDEYKHYKDQQAKLKGIEEHLEVLKQCWFSRCATLRSIIETLRK